MFGLGHGGRTNGLEMCITSGAVEAENLVFKFEFPWFECEDSTRFKSFFEFEESSCGGGFFFGDGASCECNKNASLSMVRSFERFSVITIKVIDNNKKSRKNKKNTQKLRFEIIDLNLTTTKKRRKKTLIEHAQ